MLLAQAAGSLLTLTVGNRKQRRCERRNLPVESEI